MIDVDTQSEEFKSIEGPFKLTLRKSKILKVQRIQNRRLWKVYKNEREEIEQGMLNKNSKV